MFHLHLSLCTYFFDIYNSIALFALDLLMYYYCLAFIFISFLFYLLIFWLPSATYQRSIFLLCFEGSTNSLKNVEGHWAYSSYQGAWSNLSVLYKCNKRAMGYPRTWSLMAKGVWEIMSTGIKAKWSMPRMC